MSPLVMLPVYNTALSYSDLILADSPAAYWRLEELSGNAIDSSGNGKDLAVGGSVTQGVAGKVDLAADFSTGSETGADAFRVLDDALGVGDLTSATVNLWVNINSYHSSRSYVFDQRNSGGNSNIRCAVNSTGKMEYVNNGGTIVSTGTVPTGSWQMLSWVVNGATVFFYINAVSAGSAARPSASMSPTNRRVGVGNDVFSNTRRLQGVLDEVSVYTTVLTQPRLLEYFNAA